MEYKDKLEKLPQNTYKIEASIPWSEIEKAKKEALSFLAKTAEIKGFRKGKAPLNIVQEHLGDQRILEEASKNVLNEVYPLLIKKHQLLPFMEPKITLLKAPQGGEWEFRFELAGPPVISKVPDYKKLAKEVANESKKDDIWIPGKNEPKKDESTKEDKHNKKLQLIFDKLMKQAEIEISPLILDMEVSRRLTSVYDEVKQLGLTVEQYLESKKLTAESLKEKTKAEIMDLYKSEFLLEQIADKEKITVEEKDLETIYKQAKDDNQKELYKKNSYLYVRLLRKQKTLDFLAGL